MKKVMKKIITIAGLLSLILGLGGLEAASTATLSFSPAQVSVEQGKDFMVTVSINTGAIYILFLNKDGTVRYDMTEMPMTHFKPVEIGTSVERLKELGYI